MRQIVKDFGKNFLPLFQVIAYRPVDVSRIRADFGLVGLSLGVFLFCYTAAHYPWGQSNVHPNLFAFGILAVDTILFLVLCALFCILFGLRDRGAAVYVMQIQFAILLIPLAWFVNGQNELVQLAFFVFGLWVTHAIVFAFLSGSSMRRIGSAGLFVCVVVVSTVGLSAFVVPEDLFWIEDPQDSVDYREIDTERLYYMQAELMDQQLAALEPSQAGQADLFVLGLGGFATERVFQREVVAVPEILADTFGSGKRQIQLLNSTHAPERFPLANKPNLERALTAMALQMQDEDLAVVYLTSHGGVDTFSLSFWQMNTNTMSATDLAEILDRSGIRNTVIVVSACHSGSLIDDLQAPDRMILTASSATDKSFGCSDESEWTWFGRALFKESLPENRDFRDAFAAAKKLVTQWETANEYVPSNPQIWIGSEIEETLDRFLLVHTVHAEQADGLFNR